ncbi:MAG: ABC transporter ATP-binding protein [Rickettsiales bacterium]|nr:ABC transporter ATP-binding protein [Rickettsiales bacterium]
MIIEALANALLVWLIKPALDGVFINKNHQLLMMLPVFIIITSVVRCIADYIQKYFIDLVGQHILNNLQLDLYAHLLKSDLALLSKHSSGHFLSKFTNDINNIKNGISFVIVSFAKEFITVMFLIGIMFYNETTLSIIAFLVFPLAVIPIIKLGKKMKKVIGTTQQELENYTEHLDEHFKNIRTIKSFCREKQEIKHVDNFLNRLLIHYKKSISLGALTSPIMEMLSSIAIALIIFYGGYQVLNGITSPGSFFTFIIAFISAYKPIKSLASLNLTFQTGLASTKRIFAVLDQHNTVENIATDKIYNFKNPEIIFDNISFQYEQGRPALNNVSFAIKPKQYVAIVGESGSGKSTLTNLLLKFYNPQQGKVVVDNQDLKNISTNSIRKFISIVTQDVLLFNHSIKENILYGNDSISVKKMMELTKKSNIDEFINSLPEKYNTQIGQSGIALSGGQRQKVAIARALVKDSPILILDEATSALDQISEQYIKEFLNSIRSEKTIIVITHRLSSIKDADTIFVLKKGRLVEEGNHKKLIDKKGEYYRLYKRKIII